MAQVNQLQFPGTERLGPRPPQPQSQRSPAVDKLTELAIDRFPNEPPVGMRGSIPDRVGLVDRLARRDQQRNRWKSYQARVQDDSLDEDDVEEPVPTHPRTGLPAYGPIPREVIGFRGDASVPPEASFHESSGAAWRLHAHREWVPTPLLRTGQGDVSSQRLHQTLEEPATRQSPRFAGEGKLGPEQPRVYHDPARGEYSIVDGNHRLSSDLLQGKLFSEAWVARPKDLHAMEQTTLKVRLAKSAAAHNPNVNPDEVERRQMSLFYGTGNW